MLLHILYAIFRAIFKGVKPMPFIISKRIKKTSDGKGVLSEASAGTFNFAIIENFEKMIPAGIYEIKFMWSSRFNKMNPHLMDVPKRTLIEIHPANYWHDVEGCLGAGMKIDNDAVDNSVECCEKLYPLIQMQVNPKIQIIDLPT